MMHTPPWRTLWVLLFVLPLSCEEEYCPGLSWLSEENAPSVHLLLPEDIASPLPLVFVIYDMESDPVDITPEWSPDGEEYFPATSKGGETLSLLSSPEGVWHTFIWDWGMDMGYESEGAYFAMTPSDPYGSGERTAIFISLPL